MPPFFDVHGDPTMDPYTILSLPHTATEAEIKKAYRMQMLQLHPDKLSSTLSENSIADVTEKFHNVKDAYEFLISPMHLTSRRLYMAKMASRRAEYERREAFLRRNGCTNGTHYVGCGGVSGYASGGGGAAGMAGNGMPRRSSHAHGNNFVVPPGGEMFKSRSDPDLDRVEIRDQQRGHRRSPGQPKTTRGMQNSHHATSRQRKGKNGYKSDSGGRGAKAKWGGDGRGKRPRGKKATSQKDKERRKTEPRHRSEGERRRTNNRKSREFRNATNMRERRRRTKSAPARYSSKPSSGNKHSHLKYDKSNLPREFFCPLTKRLMKDPVVDTEGNTYEREAIERWLRVQSSSPVTNGYLSLDMLRPDRQLKKAIYKATGKPRSKSQTRTKSHSTSPANELISGRVLIDSYLREISSKSKLSVNLDGMGICAFSYRRITFVVEVPITPHAGFMVYSSFDGDADRHRVSDKIEAWNSWLANIGRHSRVSYVRTGQKWVFTLRGSERDMSRCDVFQKMLEYFMEMSLKLHNLLHPMELKTVENVCLTRSAVLVS